MKKCPLCDVALEREAYEGFPLDRCPRCNGCLVRKPHAEGIKRTCEADSTQLVREAEEFVESSGHDVTCPGCFRIMEKRRTMGFPKVEYDQCDGCGSIWFDPGELAMLQLTYEASAQAQNREAMKERMAEMENDPDRKWRFEQNLAKCRDRSYTAGEAVAGGIMEGIVAGVLRSPNHGSWR